MTLFFLVCKFTFLWFRPESLFSVWVIFLGFFDLLLLFLLLYCIVPLEEFVYFHFIYFESRFIPSLFSIFGWGFQPERIQTGIYLLFYTLLASLPSLVCILFVYRSSGSLCLFLFVEIILWLVVYSMFVWFSPFWLRCLCLWFICDFLGPMLRPLSLVL
jgi:NADH-ubiquinone oxidoreductase chain 4